MPDIDFRGMIIAIALAGAGMGAAAICILPWLWSLVKPLVHAASA